MHYHFKHENNKRYMLDRLSIPDVAAAYSLRRLKTWATKAIRVRRSGDDAEADIGFIGEKLDEAALLAHCGVNSGYIKTWYDQSGNIGNDFTQTTALYQPRIVNAGIIERDFDATKCAAVWPTFASVGSANTISNATFPNTTGWSATGSAIAASNNILTNTGNGSAATCYSLTNTNTFTTAKRGYIIAKVRVTNASCTNITLALGFSGIYYTISSPVQNQWYTVSFVATGGTSNASYLYIGHTYADAATANNKVMEIDGTYGIAVVDVTNYGQPAAYFDGSNDVMTKPLYPDATQAGALWPTFASASTNTLITNGDFSVDATGWSGSGTYSASSGEGIVTITNGGTSNLSVKQFSRNVVTGRRYFLRCKVRLISVGSGVSAPSFGLRFFDGSTETTIYSQASPSIGSDYILSGVITSANTSANGGFFVFLYFSGTSGDTNTKFAIDDVVMIDVTALDTTNILGAPLMLNGVFNNAGQSGYMVSKNADAANTVQYGQLASATTYSSDIYLEGALRQATANSSAPANTQKVGTNIFTTGVQQGFINGASSGTDGNYNGALTNRANMQIGARSNNAGGTAWTTFFKGYISELIIALDTSKRSKIESSQLKYYQPK